MRKHPVIDTGATDERSRLRFQRCTWCGSAQPRPALVCRICSGESFRWEYSAGRGRVLAFPTLARTPVLPPRLMTVQLDEGPLVDGWVRGDRSEKLWADARVRVSDVEDASGRPVFELSTDDSEEPPVAAPSSVGTPRSSTPAVEGWHGLRHALAGAPAGQRARRARSGV